MIGNIEVNIWPLIIFTVFMGAMIIFASTGDDQDETPED